MGEASLTLRPAEGSLDYVERLLADSGLPAGDVRSKPGAFYVGHDGTERVGVGGLEVHGSAGLLRSLVVERSLRGRGYGTALCAALETTARQEGVEELYLLTTTAGDFFADRGYAVVDHDEAPEAIRATTEFADLCPETATCMRTQP